ncbi:MAG: peptide deformylase [Deltaproteobacteria bacterium]|nr:peptide deformylase [Deltaproteobacteria bacterium]
MALLPIVKYPDPVLKKKSLPVSPSDKTVGRLIDDMLETMYAAPGVGLAAPQVAVLKRVLVIDIGQLEGASPKGEKRKPDPKAIINPEIVHREGEILWEEGCLSLPQLILPVKRSAKIIVQGFSKEGRPIRIPAEELLAVAFQHEIDHLDGILLVDRLSRLKRDLYKKKLEKGDSPKHEEFEEVPSTSKRAYIG